MRRQSAAATALWLAVPTDVLHQFPCVGAEIQSGVALRLPPRSKSEFEREVALTNSSQILLFLS